MTGAPPSSPDANSETEGGLQFDAHPAFAAHCTSAIYDPDDAASDAIAPFGGDEGADLYAEWAGRTSELERLTLREMLELEVDPSGSKSGPVELDAFTIAAGFVHLRATGWLDREGVSWLQEALHRKNRASPNGEFATLLGDLANYPNKHPRARKPSPKRSWLRVKVGGGDRPLMQWCRDIEKALDADPSWSAWWSSAQMDALDFYPHLDGKRLDVSITEEKSHLLVVTASSPALGRLTREHLGGVVTSSTPPLPSLMTLPGYRALLDELLLTAMHAAAAQRHLQPPPQQLPS